MNESIINHLFLPHNLPSSADDDFLIKCNHENEHMILEYLKESLKSLQPIDETDMLPALKILMDCAECWSFLQNPQNFSVSNVQQKIAQLQARSFLPIYFHTQNAVILIEIEDHNIDQPLISSWQVLLPTATITSSLLPHVVFFPVTTYRLHDRSQLISTAHCELLVDFMFNNIECSKSYKAGRQVGETRDMPESHYVCQWWIQHFQEIIIENNSNTFNHFKKKHRDQIRWNNGSLPFRRSGLWMTIKTVFHTILTKYLGHNGTLVYKLLITHFLAYVIHKIYPKISIDLLVHCIRKIVRRLNKIEHLLTPTNSNVLNQWIQCVKQQIQMKINEILPKADWQELIHMKEQENNKLLIINFEPNHSEMYLHSCQELKTYFNSEKSDVPFGVASNIKKYKDNVKINQEDFIPSLNVFMKNFQYKIGIGLTRIEIWIEFCLEQWFNRPIISANEMNRFEKLSNFFDGYQKAALNHYYSEKGATDPVGYSRFVLTSLTVIRSMHKNLCNDSRFERLKQHSIHIPDLMKLFELLVLPNRNDMIRANGLWNFFNEFSLKPYPDLLSKIESADAFGVYYASRSPMMNDSLQEIRAQSDLDKQQKIQEVGNAKEKHTRLIDSIRDLSCTCTNEYDYRKSHRVICNRCIIQQQADNIKVDIYECPLPSERERAYAVIFELQMPIEIRIYRDMIWQFINRPNPHPSHNMYEWLKVPPHSNKLKPFLRGPDNCKIKLVSSTTSTTQSHYGSPSIVSTSVEDFLYENSLKIEISPIKPMEFKIECQILTPQLDHPDYKQLQIAVDSTQFVQNRVIANMSKCSERLNPTQCVEFGSFRSGHRLQWWNLLTILEMDSLFIGEESVAILIMHSMLQYGPFITDQNENFDSWCSESHEQLLKDDFIDEFIARLNRRLDDCQLNWQNELVLMVITMITMRILTVCDLTRDIQVVRLAMKCRRIGEQWINLISKNIQTISSSTSDEIIKLRLKMVNVALSCVLTFSIHPTRLSYLLSSHEHIVSLLKASTTIRDNIILNINQCNTSVFIRNIMRLSERVLLTVQPKITTLILEEHPYQSLNDFTAIYWPVISTSGTMNGNWQKRTNDPYAGWYDCQYESRYLSIDCITGTFLVDKLTIGFLPEKITNHELFQRVFGNHIFEVLPSDSPMIYITKRSYHGDGKVQYEFYFNDQTNRLIINERHIQTKDIFQLIPHYCFQNEFADTFISNHSHWWNKKEQTIDFRSIDFKNTDFLTNRPFTLSLRTGYVTTSTINNTQMLLINQSSIFFENLFKQYFIRLDDKPYIYMLFDNEIIHIHITRLGIAFQYNYETKMITSREYSDMCIDKDQWLGTLTGLTSGLLLSPSFVNNHQLGHYPYRKLIVPFGAIESKRNPKTNHQIVTIHRSSLTSHGYFVFVLNNRLKILQSSDSPTGWLYLALLHAMTSHPLPDQYTEMTGMERAFQLLYSAGCWSDQPLNELSIHILEQIASISPIVAYYPAYLTCMVKIDWKSNGLPYSMQHFGYYLVAKKIFDASHLMDFMYPSLISKKTSKLFQETNYNEMLLKNSYWNYRDSYNHSARLSAEMENDILQNNSITLYKQTSTNSSEVTNYNAVNLLNDLYKNGDVQLSDCSDLNWLPLSQWLYKGKELKSLFISLLQLADRYKTEAAGTNIDNLQRFECLLDFLHYISDKCQIKPFYLQMLKTTLKDPNISFASVTFPPFISYESIEQISILETSIPRGKRCASCQKNLIIPEVERCWTENSQYPNDDDIATSTEKTAINRLLNSWRSNKRLRSFLRVVQNLISSVPIEQFHIKLPYIPQQFGQELLGDHYKIQCESSDELIDRTLLSRTEQKFHHFNSDHFNQPVISIQTDDQQRIFPQEIFPSSNDEENALSEITNYSKSHLAKSWIKFLLDKQVKKQHPSTEQIIELLNSFREESNKFWNELIKSITLSHEQLFQIGLVIRMTPSNLICLLQQNKNNSDNSLSFVLTEDQRTLLGGTIVNWTLEQQMERALYFDNHKKWDDLEKEVSHIPHSTWIPSENISWLILELEMNITIREIQIKVANHMIKPNITADNLTTKSIVMQMNMGEGKTSVILPMLSVSLSSSDSSLVRIVVLKSLFPTNYQSLKYKLGGLLNRRILPFVCRRDFNFTAQQIEKIYERFQTALNNCDIILTSPEDILSFDLLTIDKCRRNEYEAGQSMLTMQRWLKKFIRDILDESDEILHVKYQLVYTVGDQQQLDGGAERWLTIQLILDLVKNHAQTIVHKFNEDVYYKSPTRKSSFPYFRLESDKPFLFLCEIIANDWINTKSYRDDQKQMILSFILKADSSVEHLIERFSSFDIQQCLIVRGLLTSGVLLVALKKRYRVNYGINPNPAFNRLMAVPFRAKDVAADRTEFGHPDVALVKTHLTYYYSGLNREQLLRCLNRLDKKETDPAAIYDQWILYENKDDIHAGIQQWKGVNLRDYHQREEYLFPTFRQNMFVINYFLNYFVFPREAKQFPYKMISSAWDLSSSLRSHIITGFSGTNDTQLLLPIDIRQHDLNELEKTDAIVVNNLLKSENEYYQFLQMNETSQDILKKIVNYEKPLNVIIDVGALFIHGTNHQIAVQWLKLSDKNQIDYVVYFDSDTIVVCDRQFRKHLFVTSPASERLDHCIFYLDDIHTRGTDFKFPIGFKAALTLGNGLTKDRFVQASMRMRKLGNGHSLTFWSSYEVHQQITRLKNNSLINKQENHIQLIDILRWVYENTQQSIWDGLHYWASQSLSFQRKTSAFQSIDWNNDQQVFTKMLMKQLAEQCLEPEIIELKSMYGAAKTLQTLFELHSVRYKQAEYNLSRHIQEEVLKRLKDYGGIQRRFAQLLDEEQQKELQQELEEQRQLIRLPSFTPCEPILHDEIKRLCDNHNDTMVLAQYPNVFRPLPYAFTDTTFYDICQAASWEQNLWASTEFQRVILSKDKSLNSFLRPPRWIVVYRNRDIIFVNAFEANLLMGHLRSNKSSTTTLRLLLPRIKRTQSIFVNTLSLIIPSSIDDANDSTLSLRISHEWLAQLFIFNGTLYFETVDEQTAYCQCLSLCVKPRTKVKENEAFKKGWIAADGFVGNSEHRLLLEMYQARFNSNPLAFVKQVIENRNNSHTSTKTHVGSIILNSYKLM